MRLLHCTRGKGRSLSIRLETVSDPVQYAILSHKWLSDSEEISFGDCVNAGDIAAVPELEKKKGFRKLYGSCARALKDGYSYVWIDTCCINKDSLTDLAEAINSMYLWYEKSQVCYAFLSDVPTDEEIDLRSDIYPDELFDQDPDIPVDRMGYFAQSDWFRRGWTLQELLAPRNVVFFDSGWSRIGKKSSLASEISKITGIGEDVLTAGLRCHPAGIAEKMAWAANRKTSRVEDKAYSLLGIFGVHMPIMYGEGEAAFLRLQEELIRVTNDHSIFAWGEYNLAKSVLASSPDQFEDCHSIRAVSHGKMAEAFHIIKSDPRYCIANYGLDIELPLAPVPEYPGYFYAAFACAKSESAAREIENGGEWAVMFLHRDAASSEKRFTRVDYDGKMVDFKPKSGLQWSTERIWIANRPQRVRLIYDDSAWENYIMRRRTAVDWDERISISFFENHQSLRIVDADGDQIARNEVALHISPDNDRFVWMNGKMSYPGVSKALVASKVEAPMLNLHNSYDGLDRYQRYNDSRQFMHTMVLEDRPGGGRILAVIFVTRGVWNLYVCGVERGVTAAQCTRELMRSQRPSLAASSEPSSESDEFSDGGRSDSDDGVREVPKQDVRFSSFVGFGMPFSARYTQELKFGTLLFSAAREERLGHRGVVFALTVGLAPARRIEHKTPVITEQHVVRSHVCRKLRKSTTLRFGRIGY